MTQAKANNNTNAIIKDVQLFWVKLDKPVSPFGTDQYEVQIQAPKKRLKELSAYGKVKELADGKTISLNLKKKAQKRDGTDAKKVEVVGTKKDADGKWLAIPSTNIGNGSTGNIIVMLSPFEIKAPNGKVTKSGTAVMLTKVQVTTLIKYEPTGGSFVDFDSEASNDDSDERGGPDSNDDF